MKFSQLLRLIEGKVKVAEDFEVTGVSSNSKTVKPGFVFVAIEGYKKDGFCFIKDAVSRGAKAVICEVSKRTDMDVNVPVLSVASSRRVLSLISSAVYKIPSHLKIIGITGTNGKTTTAYLIEHILKKDDFKVGTIGTINYRYDGKVYKALNTTPEPAVLCSMLETMGRNNIDYAVMEVSSHALEQFRVDNIDFKHAVFTNLSREHLDFHKSMEDYFVAKSRLFTELKPGGYGIINIDDEFAKRLVNITRSGILTYGFDRQAEVRAENISLGKEGVFFDLCIKKEKVPIASRLIATHNIYNILAACALAFAEGVSLNSLGEAVFSFSGAPGRLQKVDCGQPYSVYVDYAHTPQALESVLKNLDEFAEGRIITVFGCGGNRDKQKRPIMGEIASRLSNVVILTNDNPRDENPLDIIKDIKAGFAADDKVEVEPDRKKAIQRALSLAQRDDCVLIAGKGHESCQIVKGKELKFNDVEVVGSLLGKLNVKSV